MEAELQTVKKTLKKWESCFSFAHQRKPDKNDIESAPDNIKEVYKKYAELKKQGSSNTQGEVWGKSLNKTPKETSKGEGDENEKSYLSSVREKLYARAFTKGVGTQVRKKTIENRSAIFQPSTTTEPDGGAFPEPEGESHFNEESNSIGSTNGGSMFEKALHLTAKKTPKKIVVSDVHRPFGYHQTNAKKVAIKSQFLQSFNANISSRKESNDDVPADDDVVFEKCPESDEKNLKAKDTSPVPSAEPVNQKEVKQKSDDGNKESIKYSKRDSDSDKLTSTPNTPLRETKPEGQVVEDRNISVIKKSEDAVKSPMRKQYRSPVIKSSLQMRDGRTLNLSQVSLSNETGTGESEMNSQKRKRRFSGDDGPFGESSFFEEKDGDVIWQSDNCGQFPDDINQPSEPEESPEKAEKEPPKKKQKTFARNASTGGGGSGNYVRLNMKVKRFSRGRGGFRGGHIKRMQWKEKMKARSESFGQDKCFKCGGTGHWAKHCRGNRNNGEKTSKESVDDSEFPSLRDAMNLARGDKTVVPKKKKKVESGEKVTEDPEKVVDGQDATEDQEEDDLDIVRSAYIPPPVPPATEPLYELRPDGSLPETPKEVFDSLEALGYSGFRPGQEKAVMRILCGASTLVVLATGSGKSLCYQLPAYIYGQRSRGITLVISPLVSLMEDQVTGLPPGLSGVCLHTNMTNTQKEKVTNALKAGNVHFLLVSPETLVGGKGSGMLAGITLPQIAFACIDEAHCLSEWSHHFRPSYLRVCKVLREQLGVQCLVGLTATATLTTAASVCHHLGILDFTQATIRSAPVPKNLMMTASRDENKDEAIIHLLQGERFSSCCSIIVYCTRRQETERLATLIRTCLKDVTLGVPMEDEEPSGKGKKGKAKKSKKKKFNYWDAEAYHAGLTAAKRRRVQNAFMSGSLRVVVATVAFGMGLDKSNVRGIIHYNLPRSFESYVQEIGRAGRDGKTSHCHVFLDEEGSDMQELKRHIYGNTIDRFIIKKFIQKVFPGCRCRQLNRRKAETITECKFEDDGINYDEIDLDELMSQQESQEKSKQMDCDKENQDSLDTSSDKNNDINTACANEVSSQPDVSKQSEANKKVSRVCMGHERAVPIEDTVQNLDIKEDSISTLLCYLELHPSRWVENMTPVYAMCNLNCYGGPQQLMYIAKKCPPVAVAIAMEKRRGESHAQRSNLEFNVVKVSDKMGWESGPVKRELKLLKWNFASIEAGAAPSKTGVMVEFSNLSFHFRSPGDLTDEEIDDVVDFLNGRIQAQERTDLANLHLFYKTLFKVSFKNWFLCADDVNTERCESLRKSILEYFDHQPKLDAGQVTALTFAQEDEGSQQEELVMHCPFEGQLRSDVRQFINLYGSDHQLSGRAIARIFHGITSPCFPSEIWGRVRRFWRCHLETDFNIIRKIATEMLIGVR